MDLQPLLAAIGIGGLVTGSVWLSSIVDQSSEQSGPIAAAVAGFYAEMIELDQSKNPDFEHFGFLSVCLEGVPSIQVGDVADNLSDTILRPVAIEECSSKTVEGDFGMFTAMTYWYDQLGKEAGHLEIVGVTCPTARYCSVDLDTHAVGMTYGVERKGNRWNVVARTMRWIV